jgi:intein-encoded DNA endonuclease-like protein
MAKKLSLTQEDTQKLIQEYNSGKSLRVLETEFNHHRSILSRILKDNGIQIRDNTENNRLYHHNENYFEVIDTEQKAYWLGFIYADGFIDCQNNFGITLNSKDELHIEKFKSDISATNPINHYNGSGYNTDGSFSRILMKSKQTVSDLIDHGVFRQKTLTLKFPTVQQVPEQLIRHFIRGYFDGDGCISFYKKAYLIGFTGTYEVLKGIEEVFAGDWVITPHNNAFQINIGGNLQVLRIFHYLYDDATVFLERKCDKFLELYSKYSES